MYIAPVFTGLEYASFRTFGVGLWQARLVSEVMGSLAVLLLGLGVARIGGRTAGLIAAGLLATNFVSVMYDRAAIMEATMVSFVVASWYRLRQARRSRRAGASSAGVAAMLAYFTKASAVFFLAALGARCGDCRRACREAGIGREGRAAPTDGAAPAWYTLGGLVVGGRAQPRASSSCRTGRSTGSTTGRCRSRASRPTR